MRKIRPIKTNLNKELYNNVLEINPKTTKSYQKNEFTRSRCKFKKYSDLENCDDILSSKGFDIFCKKIEKEFVNYMKHFTNIGKYLIERGMFDAGNDNYYNVNKTRINTMCQISPNDNIEGFIHSCLENFMTSLVRRYIIMYYSLSNKEEKYLSEISRRNELDYYIRIPYFSASAMLQLDYSCFVKEKERIINDKYRVDAAKLSEEHIEHTEKFFCLHDLLTSESVMIWNKGMIKTKNSPGLYPLISGIWVNCVYRYFIRKVYEAKADDLNKNKLTTSFLQERLNKAMSGDLELIKGKIEPDTEASLKDTSFIDEISQFCSDTLTEIFTALNLFVERRQYNPDTNSLLKEVMNHYKKNLKKSTINEYKKTISELETEKEKLTKEKKEAEKKYDTIAKDNDIKELKEKIYFLEKQHKEDLKKIRKNESDYNKLLKEYEETNIENDEMELTIKEEEKAIIPEIPQNFSIAFCMQDKPGFEQPAQSIQKEFTNSIIAYSPAQITNQDMVVYLTEMLSHSLYYNFKKTAKSKGIAEWHSKIKNPKLIREQIAIYLYKKELKAS